MTRFCKRGGKRLSRKGYRSMLTCFCEWGEDAGIKAATDAAERAADPIDAVTAKIRETPAKTLAGLADKARALRYDTALSKQRDLPEEDQDWDAWAMNQFVAEIERLAASSAA
jgi:hypothetical protein